MSVVVRIESILKPEIFEQMLELLKETFPTVGFPGDTQYTGNPDRGEMFIYLPGQDALVEAQKDWLRTSQFASHYLYSNQIYVERDTMSDEERDRLQRQLKALAISVEATLDLYKIASEPYPELKCDRLFTTIIESLHTAQDAGFALAEYIGVASDAQWKV